MKKVLTAILFMSMAFGARLWASQAQGFLSIHTTTRNAVAIVDSTIVLILPADSTRLTVGVHQVRVQEGMQWNSTLLDTTISIDDATVTTLVVAEKQFYTILSEPSGAMVAIQDRELGVTPLRVTANQPLSLPLALSLSHYENAVIQPPLYSLTRVRLTPDGPVAAEMGFAAPHSLPASSGLVYASLATGIVAGTVSAIAKSRADRDANAYLLTGSASMRDRSKRYDAVAAATLLITEVSFGVLTYLLLRQ